jgi:gliding motility-associated-like protein
MRKYLLFLCVVLSPALLFASHNVAGEITYRPISSSNCYRYEIIVTTYTDFYTSTVDRCSLRVDFGDGTFAIVNRDNSPANHDSLFDNPKYAPCSGAGMGKRPDSINYPKIKRNIYITQHTYTAASVYRISVADPARVAGICNIINSGNVKFYLQSELVINDLLGCNSSPVLTNLPLDKACVKHCFYHNPGAFDPDANNGVNDSLHYSLSPCLDTTGLPLDFWSPLPVSPGGTLNIDGVTGLMTWCNPADIICVYNIAIKIEKWRKGGDGHYYYMGYVLRDMQIETSSCSNTNPNLNEPADTCVLAGTKLNIIIVGTDPTPVNQLSLTGSGDAFNVIAPAAIFPRYPTSGHFGPQPASSTFSWATTCDHVQLRPHQATFRLENDDHGTGSNGVHLLDYETMNITVIAPAPTHLQINPVGQTMKLHWNPETCNPARNGFIEYQIYRHSGCDNDSAGRCTTGVPSSWGYTLVGTTSAGNINDTNFVDNNNGQGLVTGVTYSYRVVALFSDGAESQPSHNACTQLKREIPVITHVDIDSTSAAKGAIIVRWKNAIPNTIGFNQGLDTIAYPGPYTLQIYRSMGYHSANPVLVKTITSPALYLLPTTYLDSISPLNTQDTAWSYRLTFSATVGGSPFTIGSTQRASSEFLKIVPSDRKLTLSWTEFVPWSNFKFDIYKETALYTWTKIGSTTNHSFADSNLINHHMYCYYVTANGSYFNPTLKDTLLNRSQRVCEIPVDNTPPCPPQLNLVSACETFQNTLTWTDPNHYCADDVVSYNIWYSPTGDGPLQVIQTVTVSRDTNYVFSNLPSVAGCYAVSAIDSNGVNQSLLSNIVCADNCPIYQLPNVFSPNGDNINDFYSALPYRYIESVDMKIYDRWGVLLFQTNDPHIHWDGKSIQSGKICSDGVYFYDCVVNARRLLGIVPFELKGFIQLITAPESQR